MRPSAIVIWGAAVLLAGCQTPAMKDTYPVRILPAAAINIDGKLDEPAWQKSRKLTDFKDPWAGDGEPTEFRAFVDDKNLYFSFVCVDTTPRVETLWRGEKTLDDEDRVEIYFALDEKLDNYYCIEIDPQGRVHDFKGSFPGKWDDSWNMPGLKTSSVSTPGGYTVEGSIPLSSIEALGMPAPKPGATWRMGLFRADRTTGPKGDRWSWITWIVPNSQKPNFHTPSAFGYFRFERGRGIW